MRDYGWVFQKISCIAESSPSIRRYVYIHILLKSNSECYRNTFHTFITFSFKTVEINGNVLKIGTFIVTDVVSIEKEFGEIEDILNIDEEIYLYVNIFDEVTFDGHYHAYVTTRSKKSKLVKFNDLPDLAPVFFINKNNTNFIAARYQL